MMANLFYGGVEYSTTIQTSDLGENKKKHGSMKFASGRNNGRQTVASANGYKSEIQLVGQGPVWQKRKLSVRDSDKVSGETDDVCLLSKYTELTKAPMDRLESRRLTTRRSLKSWKKEWRKGRMQWNLKHG